MENWFETTEDRWGRRKGARFVTPREYHDQLASGPAGELIRSGMTGQVLTDALAAAADDDGQILDYSPRDFYEQQVSSVLRNEDDPPGWTVSYDRFVSMALSEQLWNLCQVGLLAHRGNGDSYDYRLALPAAATLPVEV